MGCSSSRESAVRADTGVMVTGIPKATRVEKGTIADELGDVPTYKQTLLLQKNQRSIEGRQSQTLVQNLVHDEFRRQITEVYDLKAGALLGKGGFGTVQTVVHKQSGVKYALKAVELSRVKDEKSLDFFFREVEVMRKLDHPNICRLHAVYPTVEHLFMVMDLCEGGDLLMTYHFKSEQEAANIVLKVSNAVRYMHDRNIAHRDLKLDNILTDASKEGADVKLVDFGLSAHFEDFRLEHDVVGTWVYMAPEVISGSHFPRTCDMWSIGVIAYLLLCGYPPFGGSSTAELKEQIQHGTYQFHHEAWSNISGKAKNFIKRLLVRNPQERMSAAEAQHHPWLNPDAGNTELRLSKEALTNLVSFRDNNYFKKLALELVARSLDPAQIRKLQQDFSKMDKDGNGTIGFEEFESVLAGQANLSRGQIRRLFDSVDLDNGKELHFNEFLAATLGKRELDERRLRLAFDRLDFDHSGTIDKNDLKLIVGSDLEDEGIARIFAEFDLNNDGEIDFEEFTLAMRKADAPAMRLATARSSSMPHLKVSSSMRHVEKTLVHAQLQQNGDTNGSTPGMSSASDVENAENSLALRQDAVLRASFVRCASKLMEDGTRRATMAVSDPAAKRLLADIALQDTKRQSDRPHFSGPDPLAQLLSSKNTIDGSSGDAKTVVEGWGAIPPHVDEEPQPWADRAVAATMASKNLQ